MDAFKITPWGPKALRARLQQIEDAINRLNPIAGTGITIDDRPDGQQISAEQEAPEQRDDNAYGMGAGATPP